MYRGKGALTEKAWRATKLQRQAYGRAGPLSIERTGLKPGVISTHLVSIAEHLHIQRRDTYLSEEYHGQFTVAVSFTIGVPLMPAYCVSPIRASKAVHHRGEAHHPIPVDAIQCSTGRGRAEMNDSTWGQEPEQVAGEGDLGLA